MWRRRLWCRRGRHRGRIPVQPGAEQFVVGVTDAQPEQHPLGTAAVEAFAAGEQQLANPIQRVVLAATMAEGLVLHPATDPVDAAVADAHDVQQVSNTAGVGEVRGQPGTERLGQISGHHLDGRQPPRVGVGGPSSQVAALLPLTMSITTCRPRSTSPVA